MAVMKHVLIICLKHISFFFSFYLVCNYIPVEKKKGKKSLLLGLGTSQCWDRLSGHSTYVVIVQYCMFKYTHAIHCAHVQV